MSEVDDTLISALQKDATAGKKSSFGTRARPGVAAAEFSSGLDALDLDTGPEIGACAPVAQAAPKSSPKPAPKTGAEPQAVAQPAATQKPASATIAALQPVKQTGMTSWFARVWQKLRGWFAED